MTDLLFSLQASPDARLLGLIWDVFFAERGRGLSLQQHFPWLGQDHTVRYATLTDGDDIVAGLAVRPVPGTSTAAIGLVCVRADRRGAGLGRSLLDHTLPALDEIGITALTLWTGKPDVYRRQGFEVDDDSALHTITSWPQATPQAIEGTPWPRPGEARGLPPFALAAECHRSADAEVIVLKDPRGTAVAEWRGPDESVATLLSACMQAPWRLHALAGDTLPGVLAARGAQLHTEPNRLQMWRQRPGSVATPRPALRLLDRI